MQGLMQDYPLTLPPVFDRSERLYGHKQIVWGTATGRERTTVAEWADRTRRLGGVLDALGVPAGRPGSAPSPGTRRTTSGSTGPPPAPAGCCTRSTSGSSRSS